MSEWKPEPEVGQIVLAEKSTNEWVEAEYLGKPTTPFRGGSFEGMAFATADESKQLFYAYNFKPLQTKADKYRDEQIEQIRKQLIKLNHVDPKVTAARLYKMSGVRVIADNEFIGRELTDEQIDGLAKDYSYPSHGDRVSLISAVQKAIKGDRG